MTLPFQPADLLVLNLIIGIGSLVQGSIGMGLGLLAAPFLVLYSPSFIPGPMLFAGLILSFLILWRDRIAVDFAGLRMALLGRIIGTLIGAAIFVKIRGSGLSLFFGICVIAVVVISLFRSVLRPSVSNLIAAGLLSGVMATTASIGGPPIGLVYQNSKGSTIRSTLAGYFIFGTTFSIMMLAFVGGFGVPEMKLTAWFLPGLLLGFLASGYRIKNFDSKYIRYAILLISFAAGLLLICREFF